MAVNIFKKAKAYRKEHPRISFQDAIQKVSGKAVSGVKKKKKTTVKRKSAVKAKAPVKRKVTVKKTVTRTTTQKGTIIQRGQKILAEINRLEKVRKGQKDKAGKDFYALAINKEHKKLSQIQKGLK